MGEPGQPAKFVGISARDVVFWLLKLAVSTIFLAYVLQRLPDTISLQDFAVVSYAALLGGTVLAILQFFVLAYRWQLLTFWLPGFNADRASFPLRGFLLRTWISGAISQVLPALIGGDGFRIISLRAAGASLASAVQSVLVDRVFGTIGLLILVLPVLTVLWPYAVPELFSTVSIVLAFIILVAGGALLLVRRFPASQFILIHLVAYWNWRSIFAIALATLGHSLSVFIFILLAAALGVSVPVATAFLVFPTALLTSMIPISVGGWGVREFTVMSGFTLLGASSSDALNVSLFFGIFQLGISFPPLFFQSGKLVIRQHDPEK